MTSVEQIAQERARYLNSPRARSDWVRYVTVVERVRRAAEAVARASGA